jgi:HEPN domain-containing protein
MFHCQQAAEKALKAFLTFHDQPFRKTHDLASLGKQCANIDATLEARKSALVRRSMCEIRSAGIAARAVGTQGLLHLFRQSAKDFLDRLFSRSTRLLNVPRSGLGESGRITISPSVFGQVVEPINHARAVSEATHLRPGGSQQGSDCE